MRTKFFLVLILLSFGIVQAQNLSIADLTNICGKNTYEQAATILIQKGWAFYESETGRWFDGSTYRCTVWSHSRDEWDGDKAQAWFHIYCYENKVCVITYNMLDDKQYARMDAQLAGAGFKFLKTDYKDNTPTSQYANSQYLLSVTNRVEVGDRHYSGVDKFNSYVFRLIKKGSQADTKNGNKEETYNGKTFKYHLKDGHWDGLCSAYYSNGQLLMTANYVKGELSGTYKKYDYEGHLIYDGTLYNRKFTGVIKEYDNDGHIVREGNASNLHILSRSVNIYKSGASDEFVTDITFRNDENFTGTIRKYYDGELIREGKMNNGKFSGWDKKKIIERQIGGNIEDFSEYDADGALGALSLYIGLHGDTIPIYTVKVNYINNKADGEIKTYNKQNEVVYSQRYKNGEKIGDFKKFDINGNLCMNGHFNDDDEFSGKVFGYDENNVLIGEAQIKNDLLYGERKKYFPNGQLKSIEHFINGELDGHIKEYNESGMLIKDGTIHNDEFTGMAKQYDDTVLLAIVYLKNDTLHGERKRYFTNGQLMSIENFVNGELEGIFKEYSEEGALVIDGTMHNERFTGEKKVFEDNTTDIAAIFNFKEDLFHGHIVIFDKNGSIKKEGDFAEGAGQLITKDSLGRTLCIEPYTNNQENGDEILYTYSADNEIAEIQLMEYTNGDFTGNVKHISRDSLVEISERGRLLSVFNTDDTSAIENYQNKYWIKTHTIQLQNGERNGREWIRIPVDDGFDFVECTYSNDVLHGAYRVFHNSTDNFGTAKLSYSFSYSNGKPHGKYTHYGSDSTYVSKNFDHGEITYCMIPFNTDALPDASFVPYQIKFKKLENKNHWKRTFYYRDSIVEQTLHFFMEYPCPIVSLTTPSDYCYDTYTPEIFYFPLSDDICSESVYPDGAYHCTYQDGTKDIKGQYYKRNKIGEWTITYPKQSIKQVITYNRYSTQESEIFYTIEGQLYSGAFTEDFSDSYMVCPIKKGIRHGTAKIYSTATRQVIGKKKY